MSVFLSKALNFHRCLVIVCKAHNKPRGITISFLRFIIFFSNRWNHPLWKISVHFKMRPTLTPYWKQESVRKRRGFDLVRSVRSVRRGWSSTYVHYGFLTYFTVVSFMTWPSCTCWCLVTVGVRKIVKSMSVVSPHSTKNWKLFRTVS